MTHENAVEILNGAAKIESIPEAAIRWSDGTLKSHTLVFRNAFRVRPVGGSVSGCRYRVFDREFEDLSFLHGDTVLHYSNAFEVRMHKDGTKFLFSYEDIPTFDFFDREYDSMEHMAVYADSRGVHLIRCRHGYRIPRIEIYTGLTGSVPEFDEHLKRLDLQK